MNRIKLCRDPAWAPCCYVLARKRPDGTYDTRDETNTVLIQTDWDYPSVARNFGWDMRSNGCDHQHTDGTVDCQDCGEKAESFITRAAEWLSDHAVHHGFENTFLGERVAIEDPGYFA